MKRTVMLLGLFCLLVATAQAQTTKIGKVNVDYVLSKLPEYKSVESDYTAYETQLKNQLQSKVQDFQNKVADYQQNAPSYSDVVRADKEREIKSLQTSIEQFQADAEKSLANKQAELLQPLYDKIKAQVATVAKENGYTHVVSESAGLELLIYAPADADISDKVVVTMGGSVN